MPGVSDIVSGFVAFRLITLRNALRDAPEPMLRTDGWAANAELIGLAARHARRIETVPTVERHDLRHRPSRLSPWDTARALWRSRGSLHFQPPVERPAHQWSERSNWSPDAASSEPGRCGAPRLAARARAGC